MTPQPSVLYAKFQNLTSKKSTVSLFHLFISHLKRHVWYSVAAGLAACKKWGHKLAMAWGHGMPWDKMGQPWKITIFPQQRKLMGSSAQNSSGVHWCRRRVRFNEVPEKVPMVPEKVWEGGLGAQIQQGSGEGPGEGSREGSRKPWCKAKLGPPGFQRRRSGRLWCRARSSSTGFRRRSGRLWCRARLGSSRFRRRFRRRSGRLWCKAGSGSTKLRRRFREALVQSQVRFNRVPKTVPETVWEALVQRQVKFNRVPEKVPEKVLVQSQVMFNRVPEKVPEKVPGGFGAEPTRLRRRVRRRFQEALVQS